MIEQDLQISTRNYVSILTINRPHRRNALTYDLLPAHRPSTLLDCRFVLEPPELSDGGLVAGHHGNQRIEPGYTGIGLAVRQNDDRANRISFAHGPVSQFDPALDTVVERGV